MTRQEIPANFQHPQRFGNRCPKTTEYQQKAIAVQLPKCLRSNVLRLLVKANSSDLSHPQHSNCLRNIAVEALDVNCSILSKTCGARALTLSSLFLEALSTMIRRAWRWQKLPSLSRHLRWSQQVEVSSHQLCGVTRFREQHYKRGEARCGSWRWPNTAKIVI